MGKKTTKTKSESTPWAPAQPIITGAGNAILGNYNANQGNLQALTSGLTGGVIPGLQGKINDTSTLNPGKDYINNSLGSGFLTGNTANQYLTPMASGAYLNSNPANAQLSAIGNGSYLNSNPYTQAMAKAAGDAAAGQVNSTFSSAGRTGGGNHAEELARGVSSAQNQVLFQNYQNERGLQQNALGQLGGNYNTAMGLQNQAAGMLGQNYNTALGIQSQNASQLPGYYSSQFAGYTPLLGATQLAGQMPYYGSNSLSGIGGLFGGYGTQSGTQPGGWLNGVLGAGAALGSAALMAPTGGASAGLALSDSRLKENIVKVGEEADGLGIYAFNYIGQPTRYRGVMADEVAVLRPKAHVPNALGPYSGVDYSLLGEAA